MNAYELARLRLKVRYQTTVWMRRHSAALAESEARLLDGNR